jgi:hypothetical protein
MLFAQTVVFRLSIIFYVTNAADVDAAEVIQRHRLQVPVQLTIRCELLFGVESGAAFQ